MSRQKEIRKGVIGVINFRGVLATPESLTDKILTYQQSQDVVLKVKCPDCAWGQFECVLDTAGMTPCYHCNSTGYIYEPLIEVKK